MAVVVAEGRLGHAVVVVAVGGLGGWGDGGGWEVGVGEWKRGDNLMGRAFESFYTKINTFN